MLFLAVILLEVVACSVLLSTTNYMSQSVCPGPEGGDLGLVFEAAGAVQFGEGEALKLVNEQAHDGNGVVGVGEFIITQLLVSVGDPGFSEEFLPSLLDVGFGV